LEGVGIHTGSRSRLTVAPAEVNYGLIFHKDGISIPASVENVVETLRCTSLGREGVRILTVEHLLSVCFAAGIDNLDISLEGEELPIMDGSSLVLALEFQKAGIKELEEEKRLIEIKKTVYVEAGNSTIVGMPSREFSAGCMVDYNHPILGVQAVYFSGGFEEYLDNFAPARTFGFWEEIKQLLQKKLARGGSLENALVVKKDGYMNPPRFPDEVVRHKMLDLLGDLALAGVSIQGHVFAVRPSHELNVEFAKKLITS